ncbi:hypothetical protein [Ruegeria sp. HKCCD7221]|uniref:hypothetical protein n=1 Tax=Ruegeria sp. HKCCD7221 TaxID=2683009 RepID=UPI0014877D84|nr:hypothetical protein [Ruegeria sp. HKCCD7221]
MEKTAHNPVAVSFMDLTVDPVRCYFTIGPDREFFARITAELPAGVYYRFHDVDPYSVRINARGVEEGHADRHAEYIAERVTDTPWFLHGYNGIVCAHRDSWGDSPSLCGFKHSSSAWLPIIGRKPRGPGRRWKAKDDAACGVCGVALPDGVSFRGVPLPRAHPGYVTGYGHEGEGVQNPAWLDDKKNRVITCGHACAEKARYRAANGLGIVSGTRNATCACCGEAFTPKRATAKYCSAACRNRANYLANTAKAAE